MRFFQKMFNNISTKEKWLLLSLIFLGTYLRFYNLDWGVPFLHPDEFNIGLGVSRLQFPDNLNPDFFAYGSFPIYITYLLGIIWYSISEGQFINQLTAEQAILIGRYLSAICGTLLIPFVFVLAKQIGISKPYRLIASGQTTIFVGLIQYSHFATFEIFLTTFYLLISILSVSILNQSSLKKYLLLGLLIGLSVGTKIVSIYLLAIPFILSIMERIMDISQENSDYSSFQAFFKSIHYKMFFNKKISIALITAGVVFAITNPYFILDFESVQSSLKYEREVATGTLPVFYTRTFIDTTPVLFQLKSVLPFISGPLFTIFGTLATVAMLIWSLAQSNQKSLKVLVVMAVLYGYLIIHLSSYVKWTRYMIPVLPFMAISFVWMWEKLLKWIKSKTIQIILATIIVMIIFEVGMRGLSFFTLYTQPDSRVEAATWTAENIPQDATILSEVYDPSILPFNAPIGNQITIFNMYDLYDPVNPRLSEVEKLSELLATSDYILLPSRRGYKTALRLPNRFTLNANYYNHLFNGGLGFEEVYSLDREPCLVPQYLNKTDLLRSWLCPVDVQKAEETFVTFDHSSVKIFKKVEDKTTQEYYDLIVD